MAPPTPSRTQLAGAVAIVVAAAIVGVIAWGFAQQLTLAGEMRAEERRLEQAVAAKQARNDELRRQLTYVKSDEYVERWARVEARMVKPGEVAIVPLVAVIEPPQAEPAPVEEPAPRSQPLWIRLWELAFGPRNRP